MVIDKGEQGSNISTALLGKSQDECEDNSELSITEFCRLNGKLITKDLLDELLKEHYHKRGKIYKCNHCEIFAKTPSHIKDHTQTHIAYLEFDCPHCGKILGTTHALKHHKLKQHHAIIQTKKVVCKENSKPPEDAPMCKICNIQFKSQSSANCHYKSTHLGMMKFPCNYCDYEATTNFRLKEHIETQHFNEKAQCTYCGKQFSKSFIKTHIETIHEPSKIHKCGECSYETTRKELLTQHIEAKHEMNMDKYMCSQCDYKSKGKKQIREHKRKQHT